jgi:hypothetical protein
MRIMRFLSGVALAVGIAMAALVHAYGNGASPLGRKNGAYLPRKMDLPRVMLWAWERPEDLRGIDTRKAGVAFLERTVFLVGDAVVVRPRMQPLSVPPDTALVAVVRLEAQPARLGKDGAGPIGTTLSARQRDALAVAIAAAAQFPGVAGLQVDFDATLSQREFYREVLIDLRRELPEDMPLLITALASWCLHEDWLERAPIDDAVPMLFRMGTGERETRLRLEAGGDFRAPVCRQSIGVSTDETVDLAHLPAGRRLYIFSPRAWTPEAARLAIEEAHP